MTTEVIILAQGTQQRLGMAHGYKQLLPLPGCAGMPIVARTVRQVRRLLGASAQVTLVLPSGMVGPVGALRDLPGAFPDTLCTLPDPGNSSLKGIARYLEARGERHGAHHTLVLLGDVVYSWACLEALWRMAGAFGFVGTPDLSESGGELWGVAWSRASESAMLQDLRDALLRHPPFEDEYQPGQMRRWIVGWRRGDLPTRIAKLLQAGTYVDIDDYTMDVDLPHHIPLLEAASHHAAQDDIAHGLTWSSPPASSASGALYTPAPPERLPIPRPVDLKVGDRVRVARGPHAGRVGLVHDNAHVRQFLERAGLWESRKPPADSHIVLLDAEDGCGARGGRGGCNETIPAEDLELESAP